MITKSVFASEQYVDEKIGEIIENGSSNVSTPDWNQNDSTATDYIKNRPFYEDENGVHVIDPKFLPEHEHSEIENLISQEISKLETYVSNEIQKIPMDEYATEEFATNAAAAIKDDLLNGAGEAYDTLKELGELIDANHDALEALETIANGKADADHTHDDKYVTKDETNAIQLITIEEIDQICNTGIQFASLDEVNF